ncbi:hypothetical protein [Tenacibaculum sp.]|uniref:hypothetical protein n=1 Tax=Tenacibaculum sp. TaxID=1906242 RepID=UPI003D105CFA
MKREKYIQITLLIIILFIYHQEAFISQVLKLVIVFLYSLLTLYFSIMNFSNKDKGNEIKIRNYYITGFLDFLWFLIGSFVLYKNMNKFSLAITIMFIFLLLYFLSFLKIRKEDILVNDEKG